MTKPCATIIPDLLQVPLPIKLLSLVLCIWVLPCRGNPVHSPIFHTNDVVAFVGGEDVASAQHTGHLEALLTVAHHGMGVRFRNFGWEGDTVFEQPRDFGFPSLRTNLHNAGATVVIIQFGRTEALSSNISVAGFIAAYRRFVDAFSPDVRLILVTPIPFEHSEAPLPDLAKRNPTLARFAEAIRELALTRKLLCIDLFTALRSSARAPLRLTSDGLQLTPQGHAIVAGAFLRQCGLPHIVERAGDVDEHAAWENPQFENVRKAVIAKNRLWFNYSRPQNWAFLGGDRVTQPSSRDYRNPKVRWFPGEMEKFLPLIADAEKQIELSAALAATSK